MRSKIRLASMLVSLLAPSLMAAEYLVTSGSLSITNGATAVTPKLYTNHQYAVSCSTASTYKACATSTCAPTATDAPVPFDGHMLDIALTTDTSGNQVYYIGFFANGAASVCNVYDVRPATLPGL